ncbi:MAG TPA: DNA phosphorothioation system restriction enzyme [Allocoleopsis sp.]
MTNLRQNIYQVNSQNPQKYNVDGEDEIINQLLKVASSAGFYNISSSENIIFGCPKLPDSLQLRDYQLNAINNWLNHQGRGILKMATGSGKTITALAIATILCQKINLQLLLVVCPFQHLVTQWHQECEKFNLNPILAFENSRNWSNNLSRNLYNLKTGKIPFLSIITTNDTLMSDTMQTQLKYFPPLSLIIGDEAHNLGAKRSEESLPKNIGLRLGLSATPERYFDDDGTDSIFNYFGDILQPEFTLADAIKQGALVHYLYYPILVELTEDESNAYLRLTRRIGRILKYQEQENIIIGDSEESQDLTTLLIQRARIISSARHKLKALKQLMKKRLHTNHTLFYCGDSGVENTRQLKAVTHILGVELGYRVNTYTAETPLLEREQLRQQFERGDLQGLVAIKCLDEGVDIPAIQTAVILASSTNPRQFIQRRGRILRPYPGKERATLFDMIVLPPDGDRQSVHIERSLLRKELKRFVEFADLADNSGEARIKLLQLQKRYDLLDI